MNNKIETEKTLSISGQLKTFVSSLNLYTEEFEQIITSISSSLPAIEKQIDDNVLDPGGELFPFFYRVTDILPGHIHARHLHPHVDDDGP